MKLRPIIMMVAAVLSWGLLVGAGFVWLGHYEYRPGRLATGPKTWPRGCRVELAKDRPTLLMFAHPRCPCTRASMEELARLMARCEGRARVVVLFYQPPTAGKEWNQTDLWRSAAAIPGVMVQPDVEGAEASRFHSETSGQVLLYDKRGNLLFSGGITSSRGHEGDNAGRSALLTILNEGRASLSLTPVYGCSLQNPDPVCKITISPSL